MTEELSADYVVVGSGICGALLARRLALQGASSTDVGSWPPC